MLTEAIYGAGYTCGVCIYHMYNILCCTWCEGCTLFNIGRNMYDICICLCCDWTCDYEYCLMYCSGCYDGLNNTERNSNTENNNNNTESIEPVNNV
jgi:hypothetical protein